MFENGLDKCTCTRLKCKRHSNCKECITFHIKKGIPPMCKQDKKASNKTNHRKNEQDNNP